MHQGEVWYFPVKTSLVADIYLLLPVLLTPNHSYMANAAPSYKLGIRVRWYSEKEKNINESNKKVFSGPFSGLKNYEPVVCGSRSSADSQSSFWKLWTYLNPSCNAVVLLWHVAMVTVVAGRNNHVWCIRESRVKCDRLQTKTSTVQIWFDIR